MAVSNDLGGSFTCTQDGRNPNGRLPNQHAILVNNQGTLVDVDGHKAVAVIGAKDKYKSAGKTFWYFASNRKLSRFDLDGGFTGYNCR